MAIVHGPVVVLPVLPVITDGTLVALRNWLAECGIPADDVSDDDMRKLARTLPVVFAPTGEVLTGLPVEWETVHNFFQFQREWMVVVRGLDGRRAPPQPETI